MSDYLNSLKNSIKDFTIPIIFNTIPYSIVPTDETIHDVEIPVGEKINNVIDKIDETSKTIKTGLDKIKTGTRNLLNRAGDIYNKEIIDYRLHPSSNPYSSYFNPYYSHSVEALSGLIAGADSLTPVKTTVGDHLGVLNAQIAALTLPLAIGSIGPAATASGLGGALVGGYIGDKAGNYIGDKMELNENGKDLLGDVGGFIGGSILSGVGVNTAFNLSKQSIRFGNNFLQSVRILSKSMRKSPSVKTNVSSPINLDTTNENLSKPANSFDYNTQPLQTGLNLFRKQIISYIPTPSNREN